MADGESAQTYSPPEWTSQHIINQALVLKDIVLALSSVWALKNRAEDRKRRKKTGEFSFYSYSVCIHTQFFCRLTYLFLLPLSLFLLICPSRLDQCLSASHLLFRSPITVSGPGGVFPLGWQQQRDRERETDRASSGELGRRLLLFFLCLPLTLSAVAQS